MVGLQPYKMCLSEAWWYAKCYVLYTAIGTTLLMHHLLRETGSWLPPTALEDLTRGFYPLIPWQWAGPLCVHHTLWFSAPTPVQHLLWVGTQFLALFHEEQVFLGSNSCDALVYFRKERGYLREISLYPINVCVYAYVPYVGCICQLRTVHVHEVSIRIYIFMPT